jgi:hypothetical protein
MRFGSAAAALSCGVVSACGSSTHHAAPAAIPKALLLEARPIGRGPRFHPPATGPVIGPCSNRLGPRFGVHVEVFAANRVVLIAAGIGTRRPWRLSAGRIVGASCFGALVTVEPTGVVLIRPGSLLSLAGLFHSWGQPLSETRLAGFMAQPGQRVTTFIDGRRWTGQPGQVRLVRHAEIVVEVGPFVPPHRSYTFPPGT